MQQSGKRFPVGLAPLDERGWLASQPDEFKTWMAQNGRWRVYTTHQVLYQAGAEPDALYGLGSGALEVTLPLIGDEPVTLHRAEPGFWIGEGAILAKTGRVLTISAVAESRVFRIPAYALRAVLQERPEFWPCVYYLTHMNASMAATMLAEVLSLSPKARLARLFLRLADTEGKISVSQSDLSRLIGMNRSSLQRAMNDLVASGTMETGYRNLSILSRPGLEQLINEG